MPPTWQVFLCYRQVDGGPAAFWLFEHLQGRLIIGAGEGTGPPAVAVYFDQAAPAVSNWREVHQPALEASRALLVVCTPGLCSRLEGSDWVHEELEWWLANRRTAPILVDVTGDDRWIPHRIRQRWPFAQRVRLELATLETLEPGQRATRADLLIERVLGGIAGSEAAVRSEDLRAKEALVQRLQRQMRTTAAALVVALGLGVAAAVLAHVAGVRRDETNHLLAMTLIKSAESAWAEGDEASSRALAARARATAASPQIVERHLALEQWMDGHLPSARQQLALALNREHQRLIQASHLSHRIERYAGSADSRQLFESWLMLTREMEESSYDAVLKWKGLVPRAEEASRRHVRATASKEDAELLSQAEANLAHAVVSGSRSEVQAAAGGVARSYQSIARLLTEGDEAEFDRGDWRQLQRALRRSEALVDFVRYRNRYDAWVLEREGEPTRVFLGSAGEIEKAALDFKAWTTSPWSSRSRGVAIEEHAGAPEAGQALRALVWQPIERALGDGIETVYLAPDGVLATLPLAALPGRSPDTILWDERVFSWLATAWDLTRESASGSEGTLLVAPIEYSWRQFSSLPGARVEVDRVAERLGTRGIVRLVGADATEERVRKEVAGKRILHFATHGWAKRPKALRDTGGPSPGADDGPSTAQWRTPGDLGALLVSLDPALDAGIVLGGEPATPDGTRDGIVTALEFSGLDLRGVDLVVISGCNTAGTARDGVGLIGLVQAFREAGAHSVVASLHDVPDYPTAEFMAYFYERALASRMDYPAAIRAAALEMRRRGAAPMTWTAFVPYGAIR